MYPYTEDELIKMVNYYHRHVTNIVKIPQLNNDMMKEILLHSTSKIIKNLCLTNKVFKEFCNDKTFWYDKFDHDQLPQLVIIKKHEHMGHKLTIPKEMKQLPKNINQWIMAYDKMTQCHNIAIKLIDNIIKEKIFTEFNAASSDVHMSLWLPKSMIDYVMNDDRHEILLYFEITDNNFYLELITSEETSDSDEDSSRLKLKVSKKDFIMYLTLLFYQMKKIIICI